MLATYRLTVAVARVRALSSMNSARVPEEAGSDSTPRSDAQAVKMEGGKVVARTVRRVVEVGIPVMGHIGLTPQSEHKFGGYKMQGATRAQAAGLLDDDRCLEDAGVFALVVVSVPVLEPPK